MQFIAPPCLNVCSNCIFLVLPNVHVVVNYPLRAVSVPHGFVRHGFVRHGFVRHGLMC
jgi:hypothetical protein